MANITVKYKGLTGKQGSITIDNAQTLESLVSSIAADEGITQTDYYRISLNRNFAIENITYGDSSTTLAALSVVTGDEFLCTPNQNGTKEYRQIQKLEIAAKARTNDGNARSTYTITDLPTRYVGNTVVDNSNGAGGGVITNITITTPFSRNNGSGWNPAITTIQFDSGGSYGSYGYPEPIYPTATPVFNGSNFLSGITIVTGGSGWIKHPGPGFQQGQVIIDILVIQDNSTGDPDTREIKNTINTGIDVTATDITPAGLVAGRPWS